MYSSSYRPIEEDFAKLNEEEKLIFLKGEKSIEELNEKIPVEYRVSKGGKEYKVLEEEADYMAYELDLEVEELIEIRECSCKNKWEKCNPKCWYWKKQKVIKRLIIKK